MNDNVTDEGTQAIGQQIRRRREARGWTLAELARRAGTSAPALHRYENGWDRFAVGTLRRIASALGARLEIRLVGSMPSESADRPRSTRSLVKLLAPLFWDRDLTAEDLERHGDWTLRRVLRLGNREQVAAARRHYGDAAIRRVIERRGIDPRTRNYWRQILGDPSTPNARVQPPVPTAIPLVRQARRRRPPTLFGGVDGRQETDDGKPVRGLPSPVSGTTSPAAVRDSSPCTRRS
ncbi:MAG: helix-turn-helix transcriptional regulator [candidate division NC10 bacterium]|nr:helix-turn-helix transcriptional regulator [candidate division NC10 bacterium]